MEYFLGIRKIPPFTTTWINLEGIMLSEINQTKQTNKKKATKYEIIPLTYGIEKFQTHGNSSSLMFARN